jgi:hypothetical protein
MWPNKNKQPEDHIQGTLDRINNAEQAQAAKNNAAYQAALDRLRRNGVIADLDALKEMPGSSFDYTITQSGAKAYVCTNIPITFRKGSYTENNLHVSIAAEAKGDIFVTGNINIAFGSVHNECFNISARKIRKRGREQLGEFLIQKAFAANLLQRQPAGAEPPQKITAPAAPERIITSHEKTAARQAALRKRVRKIQMNP